MGIHNKEKELYQRRDWLLGHKFYRQPYLNRNTVQNILKVFVHI